MKHEQTIVVAHPPGVRELLEAEQRVTADLSFLCSLIEAQVIDISLRAERISDASANIRLRAYVLGNGRT